MVREGRCGEGGGGVVRVGRCGEEGGGVVRERGRGGRRGRNGYEKSVWWSSSYWPTPPPLPPDTLR